MASDVQVKANKQNALNSTGPKTEEGKSIAAKNSFKHGLLSEQVVINSLGEKSEELALLRDGLISDLEPVGVLEGILVDRIASNYWRLRRVVKAEEGHIRKQVDNLSYKQAMKRVKKANEYMQVSLITPSQDKLSNSYAASKFKNKLEGIKKTLEEMGYLPKDAFDDYMSIISAIEDKETFEWVMFFNEIAQGKMEKEEPEKGKKALILSLDRDIEKFRLGGEAAEEVERDEDEALGLCYSIPQQDRADYLGRYETTIENQLYKAMNHLLKLQAIRRGGRVISVSAAEVEGIGV